MRHLTLSFYYGMPLTDEIPLQNFYSQNKTLENEKTHARKQIQHLSERIRKKSNPVHQFAARNSSAASTSKSAAAAGTSSSSSSSRTASNGAYDILFRATGRQSTPQVDHSVDSTAESMLKSFNDLIREDTEDSIIYQHDSLDPSIPNNNVDVASTSKQYLTAETFDSDKDREEEQEDEEEEEKEEEEYEDNLSRVLFPKYISYNNVTTKNFA